MSVTVKFLVNESTSNVSLIGGAVLVPRGGYAPVPAVRAEHEEVIAASLRGWISISDTEPGIDPKGVPSTIEAEIAKSPYEGSTTYPGKEEEKKEDAPVQAGGDEQASPAPAAKKTAAKGTK